MFEIRIALTADRYIGVDVCMHGLVREERPDARCIMRAVMKMTNRFRFGRGYRRDHGVVLYQTPCNACIWNLFITHVLKEMQLYMDVASTGSH